jgi:anti-anti-sigma factor
MAARIQVIQPSGILDSTKTAQFRSTVNEMVNEGVDIVLVDLKDITFVDSSGLGALVIALKTIRAAGGKMYICSVNEQVKILFELTSMDRVFDVFESREAFEKAVPV